MASEKQAAHLARARAARRPRHETDHVSQAWYIQGQRNKGYIEGYRPFVKTLALLDKVDQVLEEYADHLPLTIRQIFYRLVGAHGYPKTVSAYRSLLDHLNNARRGRRIPFESIRDDSAQEITFNQFEGPGDFWRNVSAWGRSYVRDKLADQPIHIEVWCEARGITPQLARVTEPYSIPVYSRGGFDSLTVKKQLAGRIIDVEKPAIILHLGDHDPSGVSIYEELKADVEAFVKTDGGEVEFRRVALTPAIINEYGLPSDPDKESKEGRAKNWTGGSYQLEALPPDTLEAILDAAIRDVIDLNQLDASRAQEENDRASIAAKVDQL